MKVGSRLTLVLKYVSTQNFVNSTLSLMIYRSQVGGLISFNFDTVTSSSAVALTFTESPSFIRPLYSDDSSYPSANTTFDGALQIPSPLTQGFWQQPSGSLRGGFRYMTIHSTANSPVSISNVTCTISFMPHVEYMRNYTGYFYASDPVFHDRDFLTKVIVFRVCLRASY